MDGYLDYFHIVTITHQCWHKYFRTFSCLIYSIISPKYIARTRILSYRIWVCFYLIDYIYIYLKNSHVGFYIHQQSVKIPHTHDSSSLEILSSEMLLFLICETLAEVCITFQCHLPCSRKWGFNIVSVLIGHLI